MIERATAAGRRMGRQDGWRELREHGKGEGMGIAGATGPRPGQFQPSLHIGRIIGLVFASLLALFSLGVITAGGFLAWVHESRDAAGFLSTRTETLSTPTAALTSARADINVGGISWFTGHLGTIRITASSANGKAVFIGVAPQADVVSWLGSTGIDRIKQLQFEPFAATLQRVPGTISALNPPGSQAFWVARSSGTAAAQTLTWKVSHGSWVVVVANADGSPGVSVAARMGATFAWLGPLSLAVIIAGVVLLIPAVVIIVVLLRHRDRRPALAGEADRTGASPPGSQGT